MTTEFQYFSCVEGHVVQRYGTDTYIGVTRTANGWEWDTEKVVLIPIAEIARYRREYLRAVKEGSLTERTKQDHDAYLKKLEQIEKDRLATLKEPEEKPVKGEKGGKR